SAVHNFFGNSLISIANGNFIVPALLTGDVVGHLKGGHDAAVQQLHARVGFKGTDAQLRAQNWRGVELGVTREGLDYRWLKNLWGESGQQTGGFLQGWKTWKGKNPLDELHDYGKWIAGKYGAGSREFYSAMDDVWKSYNWKQEQLKYAAAFKNELANGTMTMAQIEEMTAKIVRRTTPTYSEAFDVHNKLFGKSTFGKFIGPYTMFYSEMLRNVPAIWRQGYEELLSPNNRMKAIGI